MSPPAEDWPQILRPALDRFGERNVWLAGFSALGFPPTWITEFSEARKVVLSLRRE